MQDNHCLALTMEQIRDAHHGQFGVFQTDCFGFSDDAMAALFLRAFSNYSDALAFADSHSPAAAIHLIGCPQKDLPAEEDHPLFPATSEPRGGCDEERD